jgi:hypothetical protein
VGRLTVEETRLATKPADGDVTDEPLNPYSFCPPFHDLIHCSSHLRYQEDGDHEQGEVAVPCCESVAPKPSIRPFAQLCVVRQALCPGLRTPNQSLAQVSSRSF